MVEWIDRRVSTCYKLYEFTKLATDNAYMYKKLIYANLIFINLSKIPIYQSYNLFL